MGKLEGKVALVTGAARGQGRSHAVRLAEEGADIVAVDLCSDMSTVPYPLATKDDLDETVRLVESQDRRIVAATADVSDYSALSAAVENGVAELGRLDIVVGNAGILSTGNLHELTLEEWNETIAVNLTGVFHTCRATVPHLLEGGRGGSIVLTASTAGTKGLPGLSHYGAAKHGVVGLMRALANELAPHMIRVNTVNPTSVDTAMIQNEALRRLFLPDVEHPTREQAHEIMQQVNNPMPIAWIEPSDVSAAVLFLASDDARYITGTMLQVDAGYDNH